jgi:hypothetical protein
MYGGCLGRGDGGKDERAYEGDSERGRSIRAAGIDTRHPRLGGVFPDVTTLYHVFDFHIFFFSLWVE